MKGKPRKAASSPLPGRLAGAPRIPPPADPGLRAFLDTLADLVTEAALQKLREGKDLTDPSVKTPGEFYRSPRGRRRGPGGP